MRFLAWAGSASALAWGLFSLQGGPAEQIIILSGDTQGYLSPCGCSLPMIGGIKRKAALIRSLSKPGRTTLLENGGFVEGRSEQDEMKAETIVQAMAELDATAINIGPTDAPFGEGSLLQLTQLSGNRLASLSVAHPDRRSLITTVPSGPFLVGGVAEFAQALANTIGDSPVSLDEAVKVLVDGAQEAHLKPVLMLQGGHDTAVRLARKFPQLALIQYSSIGTPPAKLEMVGTTGLATTGEHGKYVAKLVYRDGKLSSYASLGLGPEIKDDVVVGRYYETYLRRVTDAKFLEKLPLKTTPIYSGSWSCISCHPSAGRIWKLSQHRTALQTLSALHHDFDPDCVSCHVTGLGSKQGYRSATATPHLTGVGCESCHGPALLHAKNPIRNRLPKLTEKACVGCHNPLNSPNFQFEEYWRKIAHK